jgi:hypothetical protein
MELVRWDQVEGVNRFQSRINELFEDTFGRTRAQQNAAAGVWYPPVDILESKDSYLIRAELPGMRNEDLKTEESLKSRPMGSSTTGSSGLRVNFLDPSTCRKP